MSSACPPIRCLAQAPQQRVRFVVRNKRRLRKFFPEPRFEIKMVTALAAAFPSLVFSYRPLAVARSAQPRPLVLLLAEDLQAD